MNKQIDEIKELAEKLRFIDELQYNPNYTPSYQRAMCLNKLGYRKASDVAMEIFEEIEGLMWDAVIGGKYPAKVINPDKFAELKKKYESEGADDGV